MFLIRPTINWASGTYGKAGVKVVKETEIQKIQSEDEEYELGRQMKGSTAGEALLLKGTEGGNSFI